MPIKETDAKTEGERVDSLVYEYESLIGRVEKSAAELEFCRELSASADWTPSGARELLRLANHYGAFMLRNALAIAVVLGKEDGSSGF